MEQMSKKRPLVFLDVSIDGDPFERMIFELYADVAPKTAENFRALCTGERGVSPKSRKRLHYKGTFFHHIIKGSVAQGGDLLLQDGNYGECMYDGKLPDESPKLKHDRPGLLSMGIANQDGCGSLFSVTLKADHRLDRKCVVFGTLVDGHDMLKRIENAGNEEGKPTVTVKIVNSGEVKDDKKKGNKLKLGKDTVEANNHEERPKGKHRKSSKKGRKRRRYFKSESDSSSDTDSSESYSAFDSDASSLRDTSSSSDDRHTKRKRSKKDGHRYIKRKDKRCKRNDKKAKHRSKKSSPRSLSRSATASPPRRRVTGSPPHASSRRSSLKSASRSPVRPSRRSLSRNSGKPSRRSPSRSPIRLPRISASRSSGRATPRRIPSPSPARAASRSNRRSYTRSPVKSGCGVRTPVPDRCRSSSRRPVDGSPQRIRRGRGFSDRYTYARRYRSRSPYCSSVRSYRYGGRSDYGRYSSYRRSPRRYRSPPKGRAPLRYRGGRTCPIVSCSPIRYRSRSPIRSWSPTERNNGSPRVERRRKVSFLQQEPI